MYMYQSTKCLAELYYAGETINIAELYCNGKTFFVELHHAGEIRKTSFLARVAPGSIVVAFVEQY